MTTSQPPVPMSLRCLAVLPAIIMLGGYALLGPKPVESNAGAMVATAAVSHTTQEAVVAGLPPVGEELPALESADLSASR